MENIKSQRLNLLRDALKEQGRILSDQDFARKIHKDRSMLSGYLSGKAKISDKVIDAICRYFPDVNPSFLHGLDEKMFLVNPEEKKAVDAYVASLSREDLVRLVEAKDDQVKMLMEQVKILIESVNKLSGK